MRQIVLDTETTGLSAAAGDRIVEIGCVELINRRLTGRNLHLYLNPDRESHEDALKVHGLTQEFLSDKPRFENIHEQLLNFLEGAEVIIHNAPFDVSFLDAELDKVGESSFLTKVEGVVDSLALAKHLFPGKRNSLDGLCDRMGIDRSARKLHGALLDAELLAEVYLALTRGQEALIDEVALAKQAHAQKFDFSAFKLVVIPPNEQELAEHERVLTELDKASGGKTLWRQMVDEPTPQEAQKPMA